MSGERITRKKRECKRKLFINRGRVVEKKENAKENM